MKKRYLGYLLVIIVVLAAAVFLSPAASAEDVVDITFITVGEGIIDRPGPPYIIGQEMTLEAIPGEGYQFEQWSDPLGGVSGSQNPIQLIVAGSHEITATFTPIAPTCFSLSTTVPDGGGTISRSRPGDDGCPEGHYLQDSSLLLTPLPNPGYDFTRWTLFPEAVQSTVSPLEVNMDQNRTVRAEFVKGCRPLSLSITPPEGGDPTEVSPPQSEGCIASYYKVGETISLTAKPNAAQDWKVAGWARIIGEDVDIIPPQDPPNENKYSFPMPGLTDLQSLTIEVNFKQKATYGLTSAEANVFENEGEIGILIVWDDETLPAAPTIHFETSDGTAKEGKDYESKSGSRTFTKGELKKTIKFDILDDKISEGEESFFVDISIVGDDSEIELGITRVEVTIIDDEQGVPTIRFEDPPYEIDESMTSIDVAVSVFPLPMNVDEVFVDFYTEDDTAAADEDYRAVVFKPVGILVGDDQARVVINIRLLPDDRDESNETVRLVLTNVRHSSGAVLAEDPTVALLTIVDDDDPPAVGFSADEHTIKIPDNVKASIPVNLSEPSGQEVIVDYTVTLERTGESTQGVLTFDEGEEVSVLEVPVSSAIAGDEFSLQLSNPQNADLGSIITARLTVLDTDVDDCHELTLAFSGYGQAPLATGKESSLGCPGGHYVAGELIEIAAQPDIGWYVATWKGTIDDESSSLQNAVEMPDSAFTVTAAYRVPIFLSVVNKAEPLFGGPLEEEPNDLFSQANGPLQYDRNYHGAFSADDDKEDRYYFLVSKKSDITITLDDIAEDRDYDLFLYPEDWSTGEIASSREFDNLPEEISKTLEAGKYYVRVLAGGSNLTSKQYTLRVEAD